MISTGPATPPEQHTQHAPMIEVVGRESMALVSSCWYAISESASEGTCDILTHAERFVLQQGVSNIL
jgi:hypothetical protein